MKGVFRVGTPGSQIRLNVEVNPITKRSINTLALRQGKYRIRATIGDFKRVLIVTPNIPSLAHATSRDRFYGLLWRIGSPTKERCILFCVFLANKVVLLDYFASASIDQLHGVRTTTTTTTQRVVQVSETSGYPGDRLQTGHHVQRTVVTRTTKEHASGTAEVIEDVVTNDGVLRIQDKPKKGLFGFLGGKKDKTRVTPVDAPSDRKAPTKPLSDKEFRKETLKWHNHYRTIHGVPPLKHSDEVRAI
ncbi:hypothetical protein V5799_006928 [Amblyomma americanum]|uniref:Uncharacterized protein n=1 Tax=Amblyomma americanum TaxID=6943 RepID=A0AAQ4DV01_AMBAM